MLETRFIWKTKHNSRFHKQSNYLWYFLTKWR